MSGLFLAVIGLRPSVVLCAIGAVGFFACQPLIASCGQAILQSRVAHDVQGRVFALTDMVSGSTIPLATLISGPLADHVFEPLLLPRGPLASSLGRFMGVGPGRGCALLFVVTGMATVLLAALARSSSNLQLIGDAPVRSGRNGMSSPGAREAREWT